MRANNQWLPVARPWIHTFMVSLSGFQNPRILVGTPHPETTHMSVLRTRLKTKCVQLKNSTLYAAFGFSQRAWTLRVKIVTLNKAVTLLRHTLRCHLWLLRTSTLMLCSGIQVYGLLNYFVLCATDRDSKNCRQDEPHPYCSILSAALAGSSGERLSSNFVLFGQCGDVIGKRIITRCWKRANAWRPYISSLPS